MADDVKKTDMLEKLAEGWDHPEDGGVEIDSLKEKLRKRIAAEKQREIGVKARQRKLRLESGEEPLSAAGAALPETDNKNSNTFPNIRKDQKDVENGDKDDLKAGDAGPAGAADRGTVSVAKSQNLIFKIYAAKDPSAAFFEANRGDAFDGCFTGTPDIDQEPEITTEDTLNELLSTIDTGNFVPYDESSDIEEDNAPAEETTEPAPVVSFSVKEDEDIDDFENGSMEQDDDSEVEKISFFDFAATLDQDSSVDQVDQDDTLERIRMAVSDAADDIDQEDFEDVEDTSLDDLIPVEVEEPEAVEEPEEIEELEEVEEPEEIEEPEEVEEPEKIEEPEEVEEPDEPEEIEEPEEVEEPKERASKRTEDSAARRSIRDLDIGSVFMNEAASGAESVRKASLKESQKLIELLIPDADDRYARSGNDKECTECAKKLKNVLKELGVEAVITKTFAGPAVNTVTVRTDSSSGVVRNDDFAANVGSKLGCEVRVSAVAPGGAVSFEIPRTSASKLYIYDVLRSPEFAGGRSALPVPLGIDTSGNAIVPDLKVIQHLLMAGEQGSGKSTCIKAIITGLLCRTAPSDVKLMVLDPKAELPDALINVPHLIMPVEHVPERCVAALKWAVSEMSGRLDRLRKHGLGDIDEYNSGIKGGRNVKKIPGIVIIIDEFAELMSLPKANVERLILPLVQMGGQAGIHVVLSTGKLSVDAITGLIKANVGTRISFKVATRVQSRMVIDAPGAEKLLGNGDMLLCPNIMPGAIRVQGSFVSDSDVENVARSLQRTFGRPEYDDELISAVEDESAAAAAEGSNRNAAPSEKELILKAADIAFEKGSLSAADIQRIMKVGYNTAISVIEKLVTMGLLSEIKPGMTGREVLLSEDEWQYRISAGEDSDD